MPIHTHNRTSPILFLCACATADIVFFCGLCMEADFKTFYLFMKLIMVDVLSLKRQWFNRTKCLFIRPRRWLIRLVTRYLHLVYTKPTHSHLCILGVQFTSLFVQLWCSKKRPNRPSSQVLQCLSAGTIKTSSHGIFMGIECLETSF